MAFEWEVRPDAAKVVQLTKEATSEGLPCQVHVILEFTKDDVPVGTRRLTVNPGLLSEYGFADPEEKFGQLWNAIPEVSQTVKDAVRNQLPDEMLRDLWQGRKG